MSGRDRRAGDRVTAIAQPVMIPDDLPGIDDVMCRQRGEPVFAGTGPDLARRCVERRQAAAALAKMSVVRFQLDYNQMISDWAEWATTQTAMWKYTTNPNDWDWRTALM